MSGFEPQSSLSLWICSLSPFRKIQDGTPGLGELKHEAAPPYVSAYVLVTFEKRGNKGKTCLVTGLPAGVTLALLFGIFWYPARAPETLQDNLLCRYLNVLRRKGLDALAWALEF